MKIDKAVEKMKKALFYVIAVIACIGLFVRCATSPSQGGRASGPVLGQASLLQQALNLLPALPVAGNNLKFIFGGETWIASNNGRDFLAGSFTSLDTPEGSVLLILKQTYITPAAANTGSQVD